MSQWLNGPKQKMAESWSLPFLDAFGAAKNMHVYEVLVLYYLMIIGLVLDAKCYRQFLNDYWFDVGYKVPLAILSVHERKYWMALSLSCNCTNHYLIIFYFCISLIMAKML